MGVISPGERKECGVVFLKDPHPMRSVAETVLCTSKQWLPHNNKFIEINISEHVNIGIIRLTSCRRAFIHIVSLVLCYFHLLAK